MMTISLFRYPTSFIFLVLSWAGNVCAGGLASNPHNGRATMTGAIVSSACSIELENAWQTVDMGGGSTRILSKAGHGTPRKLRIRLRNCSQEQQEENVYHHSAIHIIFSGNYESDTSLFSVNGAAKGVGVSIKDNQGRVIRAGKSLPADSVNNSKQGLYYWIQMVSDGNYFHAGDYHIVIKLSMNYE